jgi:hypothetical protein
LQAGPRQPRRTFNANSEPWSRVPGRGTAFHLSISRQRDGGAVCASSGASLLDHFIQYEVQRQVESHSASAVCGKSLGNVCQLVAAFNGK